MALKFHKTDFIGNSPAYIKPKLPKDIERMGSLNGKISIPL
jgi:hypothetical protein